MATVMMLFFSPYGAWILGYLNISEASFRIAGGGILFLAALDMQAGLSVHSIIDGLTAIGRIALP